MSPRRKGRLGTIRAAALIATMAFAAALTRAQSAAPQEQPTHATTLARAQAEVFRSAWRTVLNSVVRIDTIGGAQPASPVQAGPLMIPGMAPAAPRFRQADGPTTGLVCAPDGYIITSSFNFVRDPVVITVTLHDGRQFVARLVARDVAGGLTLLHVDATDLPVPAWASSESAQPGRWALATGHGFGGREPTLSVGTISALSRLAGRALQTDAKTSPANYGGPLFDIDGRVFGVIVPKAGDQSDEFAGVEWYDSGIGFAITADYIERRLPRLRNGENLVPGYLGLEFDAATPVAGMHAAAGAAGVVVQAVAPGPAANAGILAGDVLTGIAGEPVSQLRDARRVLAQYSAGDTVALTFQRAGERQTVKVTLARAEEIDRNAESRPASQPATMPASNP